MTDPSPQVSVLIPCWNAAGTIERALDSILDTSGPTIECIVVDDASTDGTADLVRSLADRDPRIVLVRAAENAGASAARNLGLPLVRGEWLTFLDSDDRMLPGALAALHHAAVATDALAVVGQRIWSDGVDTWITRQYDRPDIREPGRKSLVANPGLMFYASGTGKLFHRSIREGLRFEGRVLGDQPWTLRALLRAGDRIEVIGDVVYEWDRPRPGNEFTSITEEKRRSAARAAEAVEVAIGAWRQVADEADRVLPDVASRRLVHAAYLDRLVRADFSGPITRALDSRDPGMGRLFGALAAFIAAASPVIAAESDAVIERLVRPPLARWNRVPRDARPAYWAMVRAIPPRTGGPERGFRAALERAAIGVGWRHPKTAGVVLANGLTLAVLATRGLLARLPGRHRSATSTAAPTHPDRR
ncbi:MAG: glycosyltransferase [Chloroflexi bacterium]|nr:glycosyltransferase [Chloroflexota bacterium]